MTVIKLKESNPIEAHIAQLKIWQRDCKKFQQTALYDLLSETIVLMKKLHKEKPDTPTENFTHTAADLAFSDYIRARANYCCERCGKQYPKNQQLCNVPTIFHGVFTAFVTTPTMRLHSATIVIIIGLVRIFWKVPHGCMND